MSLSLDHVTVTVADGSETLTILDDTSLHVAAGEVVALTGASGSGKSTLIAVAALLLQPRSGVVTIGRTNASAASPAEQTRLRRDHIGVVYQSANLFPSLTARQQVEVVAHINGNLDTAARDRAEELLVTVGLQSRLNARPAELSGGERQRVGIARALMNHPTVLLADEPTAALDADRGAQVMELLVQQAATAGTATLIVTHIPDQVAATRRITITDGRLTEPAHV